MRTMTITLLLALLSACQEEGAPDLEVGSSSSGDSSTGEPEPLESTGEVVAVRKPVPYVPCRGNEEACEIDGLATCVIAQGDEKYMQEPYSVCALYCEQDSDCPDPGKGFKPACLEIRFSGRGGCMFPCDYEYGGQGCPTNELGEPQWCDDSWRVPHCAPFPT